MDALVAEVLDCPALVDALEALLDAAVAESAALIACCVISFRVESCVESPEPPVPRYIAILFTPLQELKENKREPQFPFSVTSSD